MNVKRIAAEVVEALPSDADFGDLDEFLFEREQVQQGREDFKTGRVLSSQEVLGDVAREMRTVVWAQTAAAQFRDVNDTHGATFVAAVVEVLHCLGSSKESDITLPEMGDASIRERHVATPRTRYRLVYETRESQHR